MGDSKRKKQKIGLLFVCLGNTCRSPAAEGIMKHIISKEYLTDFFFVDSAGTSGWHVGELPDERMVKIGRSRGYNFNSRSRMMTIEDFDKFDYILVMDDNNYSNVTSLAITEEHKQKIHHITDFCRMEDCDYCPDPYYGGVKGFDKVIDILEDACNGLLDRLRVKYSI